MSRDITDRKPFWMELFRPGEFEWAFKMRKGDVREFFAPQDPGMLAERQRWIGEKPEWGLLTTPQGDPLVEAAWELALGFGHVSEPAEGARDLKELSRQWEPDLVFFDIASKTLAAACVCLPSSWDPRRWAGKGLAEVHGAVPQLQEQIGTQIDRFLAKLEPGKGFCRENWGLTKGGALNFHPELCRPSLDENLQLEEVYLRVEHQLFTGVPGGVLMGVRIENCPITDLAADAEVWAMMEEKIRTMPDGVAEYKNLLRARETLARAMGEFPGTE